MYGEVNLRCRHKDDPDEERSLRMLTEHAAYLEAVWTEKMTQKEKMVRENERLSSMTDKAFSHIPR